MWPVLVHCLFLQFLIELNSQLFSILSVLLLLLLGFKSWAFYIMVVLASDTPMSIMDMSSYHIHFIICDIVSSLHRDFIHPISLWLAAAWHQLDSNLLQTKAKLGRGMNYLLNHAAALIWSRNHRAVVRRFIICAISPQHLFPFKYSISQ